MLDILNNFAQGNLNAEQTAAQMNGLCKQVHSLSDEKIKRLGTEILAHAQTVQLKFSEGIQQYNGDIEKQKLISDAFKSYVGTIGNKNTEVKKILPYFEPPQEFDLEELFQLTETPSLPATSAAPLAAASPAAGSKDLYNAVIKGDWKKIEELIAKGIDINCDIANGSTALHFAIGRGKSGLIEKLIAAGADVNIRNAKEETALHIAAGLVSGKDLGKDVSKLIAAGADVNAYNAKGETALHISASNGASEVVKNLIAAGADVNARTTTSDAPRQMTAGNNLDFQLSSETIPDPYKAKGQTALHCAASRDYLEMMQQLMEAGADPLIKDAYGRLAGQLTSWTGFAEFLDYRLAANPGMSAEEKRCATAHMICNGLKAFGLEWGLSGYISIENVNVNLEGAHGRTMQAHLWKSITDYFARKNTPGLTSEERQAVRQAMARSTLYSTHHLNPDIKQVAASAYAAYQKGELVTFATGWPGHVVEITAYKNSKGEPFVIYTNRLPKAEEGTPNMVLYRGALTEEMIGEMMDVSMTLPGAKEKLAAKLNIRIQLLSEDNIISERKEFFANLAEKCGLQWIAPIEKSEQKVGNCPWIGAKGGLHACILLKMMEREVRENGLSMDEALQKVLEPANALYKEWEMDYRFKQLQTILNLESAVRSGEIGLEPKDYDSIILKLCQKIAERAKFQSYRDDPSMQQTIAQIEKALEEFIGKSPIPLTGLVNDQFRLLVGGEQFKWWKQGSFGIYETQSSRGESPIRHVSYVDSQGVWQDREIPPDCLTTHDLKKLMPDLTFPLTDILPWHTPAKRPDKELFDQLQKEGNAFSSPENAAAYLQNMPVASYALFPSPIRKGKFCVQFKLNGGKLSNPLVLTSPRNKSFFAIENFLQDPLKTYYKLQFEVLAPEEAKQALNPMPPGSFRLCHGSLYYKKADGLLAKMVIPQTVPMEEWHDWALAAVEDEMDKVQIRQFQNSVSAPPAKMDQMIQKMSSAQRVRRNVAKLAKECRKDLSDPPADLAKEIDRSPNGELVLQIDPNTFHLYFRQGNRLKQVLVQKSQEQLIANGKITQSWLDIKKTGTEVPY